VYFDEIGPPWPKHPCMDNAGSSESKGQQENFSAKPSPYGFARGRHMLLKSAEVDKQNPPIPGRYSQTASPVAFTVQSTVRNAGGTLLRLQQLYEMPSPELWDTYEEVTLTPGQLVFFHDGWLSYFDVSLGEVVRFWVKFCPTPPVEVTRSSPLLQAKGPLEPAQDLPLPQSKGPLEPANNSPLPPSKGSFLQRLRNRLRN
jgi:hypothetical protein